MGWEWAELGREAGKFKLEVNEAKKRLVIEQYPTIK